MRGFGELLATAAVRKATEKPLLGRPYVPLVRLYWTVGGWLHQQGGALGYGLQDHHHLLTKILLGDSSKQDPDWVANLRESVEELLPRVKADEANLDDLYLWPAMQSHGISLPTVALDNRAAKAAKKKKLSPEEAQVRMTSAFNQGATTACHFPDTFEEYWESSYRHAPIDEWQRARAHGLDLPETQPDALSLSDATADIAATVLEWTTEVALGLLDERELQALNELASGG